MTIELVCAQVTFFLKGLRTQVWAGWSEEILLEVHLNTLVARF